jgi:hypothetical protein
MMSALRYRILSLGIKELRKIEHGNVVSIRGSKEHFYLYAIKKGKWDEKHTDIIHTSGSLIEY